MGDLTSLDLGQPSDDASTTRRVDWKTVAAVIAAVVAILSWLGASPREYAELVSRVTTLEANRTNDAARMERIENKVDEILERIAK